MSFALRTLENSATSSLQFESVRATQLTADCFLSLTMTQTPPRPEVWLHSWQPLVLISNPVGWQSLISSHPHSLNVSLSHLTSSRTMAALLNKTPASVLSNPLYPRFDRFCHSPANASPWLSSSTGGSDTSKSESPQCQKPHTRQPPCSRRRRVYL